MFAEALLCLGIARFALADSTAVVSGPAAVTSVNNLDGPRSGGTRNYIQFYGDGSTGAGWPAQSQWIAFEDMFNNLKPSLAISCSQFGVPNNSDEEIGEIYNGLQQIAQASAVDHRVILAVMMQESAGCVRVPTTKAPSGNIYNPGLMQDFDGYYTCNCNQNDEYGENCGIVNPCPQYTITQMIREGAQGTDNGLGLASLINAAQQSGTWGAQTFYVAADWYNQGEYNPGVGGGLVTYASHIANYLIGWTGP